MAAKRTATSMITRELAERLRRWVIGKLPYVQSRQRLDNCNPLICSEFQSISVTSETFRLRQKACAETIRQTMVKRTHVCADLRLIGECRFVTAKSRRNAPVPFWVRA